MPITNWFNLVNSPYYANKGGLETYILPLELIVSWPYINVFIFVATKRSVGLSAGLSASVLHFGLLDASVFDAASNLS